MFGKPDICGPRTYQILPIGFATLVPTINEYTDVWALSIFTKDLKAPSYLKMTVTTTLQNYPSVQAVSITFDLYLLNPCLMTKLSFPDVSDMVMQVGSPPVT